VQCIEFEPALPPMRQQLNESMPLGSVIKVNAVYDRPFWRDAGRSGSVFDIDGTVGYAVDNSSPDHDGGVLVSFFAGAAARALGDARLGAAAAKTRQRMWLEQAVGWFGPEAATPRDYVDLDWASRPWVGGGYSGVMAPGGWTACGPALRAPVGPIHWAGSETATEWTGYVEGALQAAERAASEVQQSASA